MKLVAQITRLIPSIPNAPHLASFPATLLQPHARSSRRSPAVISTEYRRWTSAEAKARDLSQQSIDEELSEYDQQISEEKDKQAERPWHREGADQPPVRRQRSAGAMTKGEYLRHKMASRRMLTHSRQIVDHTFPTTQACPATHDTRHQQRSQRCCTIGLAHTSSTATVIP